MLAEGAGSSSNGGSLSGLVPSFVRSSSNLRANAGAHTDSPVNGLLYVRGTVGAQPHADHWVLALECIHTGCDALVSQGQYVSQLRHVNESTIYKTQKLRCWWLD